MALRTGLAAQLTSPVAESTYGVAPSLSGAKFSAFKSETLSLKKTNVQGIGLLSGKLYPQSVRRVFTNWSADGNITMDLPVRGLQQWLPPMFGSYGQTASALTQDASTGAYVSYHSPGPLEGNSFCLQKGVPTVDNGTIEPVTYTGCKIVDWTLSVATGQIAQLVLSIDARNELAATNAGVATPGMPASTTPVTNSSGGAVSVVITGGTLTIVSVNGVTVGTTAGTYIVPSGGTIAITYSSAPTWAWSAASLNNDPLNSGIPPLQAYVAPALGSVFHFRQATLYSGGTVSTATVNGSPVTTVATPVAVANVLSAQIKHAVPLDTTRFFLGQGGFKGEQLQNALREITGQFVIEWLSSEAMYATFAADTPTSLQLQFLGPGIGTGADKSTFNLLIPNIFLNAAPIEVPGPEPIKQTIPFNGLDDGANNVIQGTYWTLDVS